MNRKAYPTDLKDARWELLEKAKPGGRSRSVDLRDILNAIFYRERSLVVSGSACPCAEHE